MRVDSTLLVLGCGPPRVVEVAHFSQDACVARRARLDRVPDRRLLLASLTQYEGRGRKRISILGRHRVSFESTMTKISHAYRFATSGSVKSGSSSAGSLRDKTSVLCWKLHRGRRAAHRGAFVMLRAMLSSVI